MYTIAVGHYIFAAQYFELALKLPLIVKLTSLGGSEAQKKSKRIDLIMLIINVTFYSVFAFFQCLHFFREYATTHYKMFFNVAASLQVFSLVLLILSVQLIKRDIIRLNRRSISPRAKLMAVHTYLFLFNILLVIAQFVALYRQI